MTVKELKEKLSFYNDDVEVFTGIYDDIMGVVHYGAPRIDQEHVEAHVNKIGNTCYTKFAYYKNSKKATILVIE